MNPFDRYQRIRTILDDFGVFHPLSYESMNLVEEIIKILLSTKASLQKSLDSVHCNRKKAASLEKELYTFKKENNDLNKKITDITLQMTKDQESNSIKKNFLKCQVAELEDKISDLEFILNEQTVQIGELQNELLDKNSKSVGGKPTISSGKMDEYFFTVSSLKSGLIEELYKLRKEKRGFESIEQNLYSKIDDKNKEIDNLKLKLNQLEKYVSSFEDKCQCHRQKELSDNLMSKEVPSLTCRNTKKIQSTSRMNKSNPQTAVNYLKDSFNMIETSKPLMNFASGLHLSNKNDNVEAESQKTEILDDNILNLKKEKGALIDRLKFVSEAEKAILTEMDGLMKENAALKCKLAAYDNAGKLPIASNRKSDKLSDFTQRFDQKLNPKEPSELPSTRDLKETAVTDEKEISGEYLFEGSVNKKIGVDSCKPAEIFQPNQDPGLLVNLIKERDYFCCEFQRLKDRILRLARLQTNVSVVDCPFANLELITSFLKSVLFKRDELDSKKTCNTNKASIHPECICGNNQFSSLLKSYEIQIDNLKTTVAEHSVIKDKLMSKICFEKDICSRYKQKLETLLETNGCLNAKYGKMKILLEETERSLRNSEDTKKISENELTCALSKLQRMEKEKEKIEYEKTNLKKMMTYLDKEKDILSIKLDEKAEKQIMLEEELKRNKKVSSDQFNQIIELRNNLKALENVHNQCELKSRKRHKDYFELKSNVEKLQRENNVLFTNNRRLQDEISAALTDSYKANHDLHSAKEEIELLKMKLQSYVSEVRRIEDLLQAKEEERQSMLEQLKGLNIDSFSMNSRSLDRSNGLSAELFSDLKDRLLSYESEVEQKNTLLIQMEKEMENLKTQVNHRDHK